MDLIRLTTRGDEELALAVIEFSVGRRAARLGCCSDWFNCLDVKHGQLRRKLLRLFSQHCRAQPGSQRTEDGGDVFFSHPASAPFCISTSVKHSAARISWDVSALCCK